MGIELPVVYSIDNNYAQHCATSIASLLTNASDKYEIHIFVICEFLTEENRERLQKTTEIRKCKLSFVTVDGDKFRDIQVGSPWTNSILHRLMVPSILSSYSKAIYLDADTVVEGDISELFDLDELGDHLLGAVDESEMYGRVRTLMHSFRIKIIPTYGYFNSGVLLLNLAKMRKIGFENTCIDIIVANKKKGFTFPDQDALNLATQGDYCHLSPIWNLQSHAKYAAKLFRKYKKNVKIVHFAGCIKPWNIKRSLICRYFPDIRINSSVRYYKYLDLTPWKDHKQLTSYKHLIRRFIAFFDVISAALNYIASEKLERKIARNMDEIPD
jgi:lipopolysaccharide biosynthesis glycosyltransferase